MRSLGRILREEREKRGLSLDELVKQTRISKRSLEALEDDNTAALGSIFYFRSFAKQVAGVLQLNQNAAEWQQALADANSADMPAPPAPPAPAPPSYVPKVAPLRPQRESRWRSASPVLSFIVVLLVCSGIYAVLDRFDPSEAPEFTNPAPADETKHVASTEPVLHRPATAQDAILLKIAAVEKTWLAVDTDGKRIYSGLLDAEDTKELEGRTIAKLKTGNAGGLSVTFNGKELGPLGERGQVRTVVFTRDRYQILGPSLTSRLQLLPAMSLQQWAR